MDVWSFLADRRRVVLSVFRSYIRWETKKFERLTTASSAMGIWEAPAALVSTGVLISLGISGLTASRWTLDIAPAMYAILASLSIMAFGYVTIWVAGWLLYRKNFYRILLSIFGCHFLAVQITVAVLCCVIIIEPVARTDLFLLRDGHGAETPIYDVACGNLSRVAKILSYERDVLEENVKFKREMDLWRTERSPGREWALQRAREVLESRDILIWQMRETEIEREKAWSTLRSSYPSLKISYWISVFIFVFIFLSSQIHVWKVIVLRRGSITLIRVLLFILISYVSPISVFFSYGALKGIQYYNDPESVNRERANALRLRAADMAKYCPKIDLHGL